MLYPSKGLVLRQSWNMVEEEEEEKEEGEKEEEDWECGLGGRLFT